MTVTYFLKGIQVTPRKKGGIFIEVNHDQQSVVDQPAPHVGISNLYFTREDVKTIRNLLKQPPGITEGLPFDVVVKERALTETIRLYLDCTKDFELSKDGVLVSVAMKNSLDALDNRIDGFTFESLYNEIGVTPFVIDGEGFNSYQEFLDKRCIYIPYVISTVPNWHDAFMAILGMTYIGTEIYKITREIEAAIASLASDPFSWGEVARITILVAFATLLLITLIGLVTQLVNCLIQPMKYHGAMLFSDLYKIVCVKLGLEADAAIYNSHPFNKLAYLPEKYNPVEGNASTFSLMGISTSGFGTRGYTSPGLAPSTAHDSSTDNIQHGYPNFVGGDLMRLMKQLCNGKYIIPDDQNKLVLLRRDEYPIAPQFQFPDIRMDWNGYNLDELDATIILKFIADMNDKNCIDHIDPVGNPFYTGTVLQATHQQITTEDQQLVLLKGLREISFPVARGVAKDSLTFVEKIIGDIETVWSGVENIAITVGLVIADIIIGVVNSFIVLWNLIIDVLHAITNVINVIIDAINDITFGLTSIDHIHIFDNGAGKIGLIVAPDPFNFQSLPPHTFNDRLGALLLENDMVDVPKVLMVDTDRIEFINQRKAFIHAENATVVNAKYIWDNFYSIDAFVGAKNNRFTKLSPALDEPGELNKIILPVRGFKTLVVNPQFNDNFGEPVIADSIRWYPEKGGQAEFLFRKKGLLADPQNKNAVKRAEEIAINLKLSISIPNGQ